MNLLSVQVTRYIDHHYLSRNSYTARASIYTTQRLDYCGDVWEFFDTPRVRATATVKLLSPFIHITLTRTVR